MNLHLIVSFPIYKYTYVTAVCAETEMDDLNKNLSVVTYDYVDCHTTKNLDFSKNKINESNVVNDNEDTSNFSSKVFSSNNVDESILKLTSQMKQNLISAKQDFDKYLQSNLVGKTKTRFQDSITAKES